LSDWGTQPKTGAPTTVNVGADTISLMLSPTPLSWLLPLYSLIQPITLDTATLCATEPPPAESWTIGDLLRSIDPAQHQFETDKLARMVRASVWPTYCEYRPAPVPTDSVVGSPHFAGDDTFGHVSWPDLNGWELVGAPNAPWITGPVVDETVDFWVVVVTCMQSSTDWAYPALHVLNSSGGNYANIGWGTLPTSPGHQIMVILLPPNLFPEAGQQHRWAVSVPSSGKWVWRLTKWHLTPPPVPPPWPKAASAPDSQFSDQCVSELCLMASQWPGHKTGQELLSGQVIELNTLDTSIKTEVDALQALLGSGTPDKIDPTQHTGAVGGSRVTLPAGAKGIIITANAPVDLGGLTGDPTAYYDLGYVTEGTLQGWKQSARLKHSPQIFHPFDPMTTRLSVSLPDGTTWTYYWIVAGP
jgi:hypothetical protein